MRQDSHTWKEHSKENRNKICWVNKDDFRFLKNFKSNQQ